MSIETTADSRSAPAKRAGRGFALGMLSFIYVLNFLDRQLISILAKPIQDDLGISDGQLGMITGLYFALFYCTIAIPVGWLADRTNRIKVLSVACGLWSAATAACGLATNFGQLAVARMTVAVGEAGGVPPSYAVISDLYPPEKRGTALAIFNLGPPIGSALGVAFGASIAAVFDWRIPFYVMGAVGVVTAVVLYAFVKEPPRTRPAPAGEAAASIGFLGTIRQYFANPVLCLASLASGAANFITYGMINFATLFLMREKGMELGEVALYYALVVGIGMSAGIFISGRLIDKFGRRSKASYATIPAISLFVAMPFFLGFVWAPTWQLSLMFLIVPTTLNSFFLTATVTFVQGEVSSDRRVISGALLLFVMNLIGLGLGPSYVGMASDFFRASHGLHALQMALYGLAPVYLIAGGMYLALAWLIRKREGTQEAALR